MVPEDKHLAAQDVALNCVFPKMKVQTFPNLFTTSDYQLKVRNKDYIQNCHSKDIVPASIQYQVGSPYTDAVSKQ